MNIWPISAYNSFGKSTLYLFWCTSKVHLNSLMSNQSNYMQCVKDSYILRPLTIVDWMLCFIFYHLHLKDAEEKHAVIISIIKTVSCWNKQELNLPLWHIWLILQWILMILSELSKNTKSHVLLFDQAVFKYSWCGKNVSGIKNKG